MGMLPRFKAWNGREMSAPFDLGCYPEFTDPWPKWDGTWTFLQYLGFSDKQKTDIFEGDRIEIYDPPDMSDYTFYGLCMTEAKSEPLREDVATMSRFPVYWLKNEKKDELVLPSNTMVVGNIYEKLP